MTGSANGLIFGCPYRSVICQSTDKIAVTIRACAGACRTIPHRLAARVSKSVPTDFGDRIIRGTGPEAIVVVAGIGYKRWNKMAGVASNRGGPARSAQMNGVRTYGQSRIRHFSPQPLRRCAGQIVGAAMTLNALAQQLTVASYTRNT